MTPLRKLSKGRQEFISPRLENILPELKTVLPNADFVIEGYVDPTEPLRDERPFGDHTGYYTLPEPYPVFHVTAITHRQPRFAGLLRAAR